MLLLANTDPFLTKKRKSKMQIWIISDVSHLSQLTFSVTCSYFNPKGFLGRTCQGACVLIFHAGSCPWLSKFNRHISSILWRCLWLKLHLIIVHISKFIINFRIFVLQSCRFSSCVGFVIYVAEKLLLGSSLLTASQVHASDLGTRTSCLVLWLFSIHQDFLIV